MHQGGRAVLIDLIKKLLPSAKIKPATNGYFVEYSKPTEFVTKVTNEKQVELLERILDNAGATK